MLPAHYGIDKNSGNLQRDLGDQRRVMLIRGEPQRVRTLNAKERVLRFIVCTEGVKRDGHKVRIGDLNKGDTYGFDFTNFAKNPVALWTHDYGAEGRPPLMPVGAWRNWVVEVENGKRQLVADLKFASHQMASDLYQLYLPEEEGGDGCGHACSIGWVPLTWEEMRSANGAYIGHDFLTGEMLEISPCGIPADPDATLKKLSRAMNAGRVSRETVERLADWGMLPKKLRGYAYVLDHRSADAAHTRAMTKGDRVKVKAGKEHDAMTKGAAGEVVEVSTSALGIKFDGMDGVHRWYVESELEAADDNPEQIEGDEMSRAIAALLDDESAHGNTGDKSTIDNTESRDVATEGGGKQSEASPTAEVRHGIFWTEVCRTIAFSFGTVARGQMSDAMDQAKDRACALHSQLYGVLDQLSWEITTLFVKGRDMIGIEAAPSYPTDDDWARRCVKRGAALAASLSDTFAEMEDIMAGEAGAEGEPETASADAPLTRVGKKLASKTPEGEDQDEPETPDEEDDEDEDPEKTLALELGDVMERATAKIRGEQPGAHGDHREWLDDDRLARFAKALGRNEKSSVKDDEPIGTRADFADILLSIDRVSAKLGSGRSARGGN
ncbi:HK97 family phage prohead protease [Candidatus Binatia bacterium]|nr:HK97 family phage prohead protease [Candidatus Binatia bacterium]